MAEAIRTLGLTRYYGELCAVDHLDLSVERGELFAFLGPNGAGKTTTIRLLTGLIRPTEGTALIEGLDVRRNPLEVKSRVGVVPERSNLYNELSARENLVFMAKLYGLARREWHFRADELLADFGLGERADSPFGTLSGGLKRRLTIAAALVHRPSILFLDEPTTGLDVRSARALRTMIRALRAGGVTIFLTTHFIAEAERLCDRVGIIVEGKLIVVDTPGALRASCRGDIRLDLVAPSLNEELRAALRRSPEIINLSRTGDTWHLGVRSVDAGLRAIVDMSRQCGVPIEAIHTANPSLEDAFVQLTGIDVETLQRNKPQRKGGAKE